MISHLSLRTKASKSLTLDDRLGLTRIHIATAQLLVERFERQGSLDAEDRASAEQVMNWLDDDAIALNYWIDALIDDPSANRGEIEAAREMVGFLADRLDQILYS